MGYVDRGRVRVAAGNPVCAMADLSEVTAAFERASAESGRRVCYLGADEALARVCASSPRHARIVVGAQPIVDPRNWSHTIAGHASLRAQLNRARNKGVGVREWPPEEATNHPALQACLEQWLAARALPPLHFLVEPHTLGRLADRRTFVAEREGAVVGLCVASPAPARGGWQLEQLVRGPAAPNGTMELLVDAALREFDRMGVERVALGAAPLSPRSPALPDTPPVVRAALSWPRSRGARFYDFEGLERFKAKFWPHAWEPVFAISCERRFSLSTLYAVAGAFTGRSPLGALGRSLWRAVVPSGS